MATLTRLVEDRTDLSVEDRDLLTRIVEQWSLIADLSLSDLVLWVPTWNEGGLVAVAQVRPTTAPTSVPEDVVGADGLFNVAKLLGPTECKHGENWGFDFQGIWVNGNCAAEFAVQ